MERHNRYLYILFDLDGTLLDSRQAYLDTLQQALSAGRIQVKSIDPDEVLGLSQTQTLQILQIPADKQAALKQDWNQRLKALNRSIQLFYGITAVLGRLQERGIRPGVFSTHRMSFSCNTEEISLPLALSPYIHFALTDDLGAEDLLMRYLAMHGLNRSEVLVVGSNLNTAAAAAAVGLDFALAMWDKPPRRHVQAAYYLRTPFDLLSIAGQEAGADNLWLKYALEIQAIGQIGLAYCHDQFDEERFTRLREIAAQMTAELTQTSLKQVKEALCFDKGYITPKLDTRAAVINDQGKILMVRENSGLWSLPGGWCDEDESIVSNTLKEVREEACMQVTPLRLIAVHKRSLHNYPPLPYGVLKSFLLCLPGPGEFCVNDETKERRFFRLEDIDEKTLRYDTTTPEQLAMCLEAWRRGSDWVPVID